MRNDANPPRIKISTAPSTAGALGCESGREAHRLAQIDGPKLPAGTGIRISKTKVVRMEATRDDLKSQVFSRAVSPGALDALAAATDLRKAPVGTILTERGTRADEVYFVVSGELHAEIGTPSGRRLLLHRLEPGDLFGELAGIDGGGRVREVQSVAPSVVGVIRTQAFDRWLMDHPAALKAVAAHLAGQVRDLSDRLYELTCFDVPTRVRLFLLRRLIAADMLRDGGSLDPAPQRAVIAREIGANREAVSRALSRLAAEGLVMIDRTAITVRDAAGLERAPVPGAGA